MKKYFVISIFTILFSSVLFAQYSISFGLPNIDVSTLNKGDDVIIPITIVDKDPNGPVLGSYCVGLNLYFTFNHDLLKWKGTAEQPLAGVQNFSESCPYAKKDWLFNDNGTVQICVWIDPIYSGEPFPKGTVLFEYVFTYLGGLNEGQTSELVWTNEQVIENGLIKIGKSEAYTDNLVSYDEIKLINGSLFSK